MANASTSAEISSLTSQLSAAQSALADAIAENQTAVSGVTADITALEASVAELKTSLANAATSEESEAIQAQLTAAQTALEDAIASASNGVTDNATAIEALETALDELATNLAALQTSLNAAATAAEVEELQTALAAAQADLSEILAQNNVYTGDITITNASTLAAAEQLGNKVRIVNGSVGITHNSSVDATKLAAVMAKMVTITGSVTYTHALSDVEPVSFTKLTSAGNIKLDQDGPISLPVLASTGLANLVYDAKVTSISLPKLETVSQFSSDAIGGANVVTIDLGSLVRYPQSTLTVTVKSTGDTTVDLASLTTKAEATGLETTLGFTLNGGDDLSLPLFVKGSITASNVKTLTLPKFVFTGSNLNTGSTKLETLAAHEVRATLNLTGYTKLGSVDIIGTIDESTTNRSVAGGVTLSGNTNLTSASFKGLLNSVDISGADDLTSVTTAGMIRSFRLNNSDDLTSLTLGHAGISGVTNTGSQNASNRTSLKITNNDALTSFTAEEIASLGTLHITGNSALTAFNLKSTLSLGTALSSTGAAAAEIVDVQINNNALSGSVQLPSDFGVSPIVAGKITQASLSNISTYLKAAEAAIKTPALLTSGGVTTGWDYDMLAYTGTASSGGVASTAFSSVDVDVDIDVLTSQTTALGVVTNPNTSFDVIDNTTSGSEGSDQTEKMAAATSFFSGDSNTNVSVKSGTQHTITSADLLASSTQAAELVELTSSPIWSQYGITGTAGVANKRTQITIGGTPAAGDIISVVWGSLGQYSFTYTLVADDVAGDDAAADRVLVATAVSKAWNAYNFSASTTASETITDAMAINAPKDGGTADAVVRIFTGTNSGTTDFLYDPFEADYYDGLTVTADNSTTAVVANANDFYVTATATISSTSASDIALSVSGSTVITSGTVTGTTNNQVESGSDGTNTITVHTRGTENAVRASAVINSAAVPSVNASIRKRATWLD